jgi:hypothetical protein
MTENQIKITKNLALLTGSLCHEINPIIPENKAK